MYLRRIAREREDGSQVVYVQLAESYRDDAGQARARVLTSFGSEDDLDVPAIRRLLDVLVPLACGDVERSGAAPRVLRALPVGTALACAAVWDDLGLDRLGPPRLSRALWCLVVADLLAPADEPASVGWARVHAHVPLLATVTDGELDRAEAWACDLSPEAFTPLLVAGLEQLGLLDVADPIVGLEHGPEVPPGPTLLRTFATHTSLDEMTWFTPDGVPVATGSTPPACLHGRAVRRVASPPRIASEGWIAEVRAEPWPASAASRPRRIDKDVTMRVLAAEGADRFETRSARSAREEVARDADLATKVAGDLAGWCGVCDPVRHAVCCFEAHEATAPLVCRTADRQLVLDRKRIRARKAMAGVRQWAHGGAQVAPRGLARAMVTLPPRVEALLAPTVIELLGDVLKRTIELRTGRPWPVARALLDTVIEVHVETADGVVPSRSSASAEVRAMLAACGAA
ncbi:MAG: hypothetical protein H6733_09845 [Alphaproteobacteria bacterium]|nr:hypothetical protein [Alphaproteobacteria bacterium]